MIYNVKIYDLSHGISNSDIVVKAEKLREHVINFETTFLYIDLIKTCQQEPIVFLIKSNLESNMSELC